MLKHIIFFAVVIGGGYYYWTTRPVKYGPGVVAPNKPEQHQALGVWDFDYKAYEIHPLANFKCETRVLSKKRYYQDKMSDIAPYDFVVGWGPMSDERNLDEILIRQSNRSFDWELTHYPIPEQQINSHAANMHLIASNQKIREKISDIRVGQIIQLKGYLIKVSSTDNHWSLSSSLSRTDIGDDASELVWVDDLIVK